MSSRCNHERSARFRITENQQLLGPHSEAGTLGIGAEVDAAKYQYAPLFQQRFQTIEGLGNRMLGG